jgi:hypothetical protein
LLRTYLNFGKVGRVLGDHAQFEVEPALPFPRCGNLNQDSSLPVSSSVALTHKYDSGHATVQHEYIFVLTSPSLPQKPLYHKRANRSWSIANKPRTTKRVCAHHPAATRHHSNTTRQGSQLNITAALVVRTPIRPLTRALPCTSSESFFHTLLR